MTGWAILLQWSRFGFSAAVFLWAARVLPLDAIGAFATAFAVARVLQVMHKAGVSELTVVSEAREASLFALSVAAGLFLAALSALAVFLMPSEARMMMLSLAMLPIINGVSAVSEGVMRRKMEFRALALRTVTAQGVAAAIAFWGLAAGWGAWSLIAYTLCQAGIGAVIVCTLAPPAMRPLPRISELRPLLPDLWRLSLRAISGSAIFPSAQLLVSIFLGLPVAGAFQIAVRVVEVIDTLALAPLRYLALPRFREMVGQTCFAPALKQSQWRAALLACTLYPAALLLAPLCLPPLIGTGKAAAAMPMLAPLLVTGAISALLMPLTQALIACNLTGLPLRRTLLTLFLSVGLLALGLGHPLAFWALPLSAALAALNFLLRANQALFPGRSSRGAPA